MTTLADINDFLSQHTFAVVGVSRNGRKIGNAVFRELRAKGYRVHPVNAHADAVEGQPCFPSLGSLPEPVDGIICAVPPEETEKVVRDAIATGAKRVWMLRGAASALAVSLCRNHGITVIHDECILMFAHPALPHRAHRFFRKLTGKLPR